MTVFISSNIATSRNIAKKFNSFGKKCVAVEVEYGNESLTTKDIGVEDYYNHHHIGPDAKQPCLAYNYISDKVNINFQNFIISHIDADTIFGIGWLSGLFKLTNECSYQKLIHISDIISLNDLNGSHNIPLDLIKKYNIHKELEVIKSFVIHAKKSIQKVKYKNFYNCSSIIYKTILNIIRILTHPTILEARYDKITKNIKENFEDILPLDGSNEKVRIYPKRKNDFVDGSHDFIIIRNIGISVFGRNNEIVKKYFPEGLNGFMKKFFEYGGGHFAAAGGGRLKSVSNKDYQIFLKVFLERIENGN